MILEPHFTPRVLVVDDNPMILDVIVQHLEEYDFEIMTARTGEKGVENAQRGQPDLILLDVMMPGINGFEACRRLKSDETTREIPVIFMTARSDVEDQVQGFAVGGVDYITKPVQRAILFARVQTHLRLRAQQQTVERQATELEQAKQRAEDAQAHAEFANRAKSIFLANMSHELRTPLTAILGFTQLMEGNSQIPSEERENLHIIRRSGDHLLTLMNQILDLSKIEAGHLTLNEKELDLNGLLNDLKAMFFLKTQHKGLELVFDCADDVPRYMRTDEVKLRQALINVLNNAVKFTDEGGVTVRVRTQSGGEMDAATLPRLSFEVSDTGPGIAPDEMGTVFTAFGQTESGRQAQEGTGLGLSISRKFAQLMGGDITVNSAVGQGTTFCVEIQPSVCAAPMKTAARSARRALALAPDQPRYRLLIVDDTPDTRQLLVKLLAPFGFELREAANGQKAIDVWEQWRPDLIWMDTRMPILDGYEATKQIRQAEQRGESERTVIIALSASAFREERCAALANGCDDFLQKPFRGADLFDVLQTYLGVQFVYEEEAERDAISKRQGTTLRSDTLAVLPAELLSKLEQAALTSDIHKISVLIDDIRFHSPDIADALTHLADSYKYMEIVTVLRQAPPAPTTKSPDVF
ncbi:MAG: response regulator [bacterium]|nr:response regulator [bacterium]